MINRIKFTSGKMIKLDFDHYNIVLMHGDKEVYKGTLDRLTAAEMINKYNNIIIITPTK